MIKLLVKFGDESREVEIKETDISIGRSTDNVLPLGDKKSSRKHATIQKVGDEYRINDLGSGNGTKVNGSKIDFHTLKQGDEIKIGDAILTLKAIDEGADAMDATDDGDESDEIKIADDADDHKLEIVGEDEGKETEKIAWSEAETEVQAPSVKAKPAAKPVAKAPPPKPAPGKPAAAPMGRPRRQAPK
jgi:pSer/pThr/pTyr-binding forkhead associated (FHA) protein